MHDEQLDKLDDIEMKDRSPARAGRKRGTRRTARLPGRQFAEHRATRRVIAESRPTRRVLRQPRPW